MNEEDPILTKEEKVCSRESCHLVTFEQSWNGKIKHVVFMNEEFAFDYMKQLMEGIA